MTEPGIRGKIEARTKRWREVLRLWVEQPTRANDSVSLALVIDKPDGSMGRVIELTPSQALALAEQLRAGALIAAEIDCLDCANADHFGIKDVGRDIPETAQ